MQIKSFEGKSYIFRGGLCTLKGVIFQGKPMVMTLKEFNEIKQGVEDGY